MAPAALALDIDGTIDTADPVQLSRLKDAASRMRVPLYINTARSSAYCRRPDSLSTKITKRANHHCLVSHDVPQSKLDNMEKIMKNAKVSEPACVILVDDRPENIEKVSDHGFTGIKVQHDKGIRNETVDEAIEKMRRCAANPKLRGTFVEGRWRRRARLLVLVLIAVLIAMYVRLL